MAVVLWLSYYVPSIISFQKEKPVLQRERVKGLYELWIYVLTKWMAEVPVLAAVSFVTLIMIFYAVPFQNNIQTFLQFYLVLFLEIQGAVAVGHCLSSLFDEETKAVGLAALFGNPIILFGGFYISLKGIMQQTPQRFLAWCQYISPVRWAFQGLMLSEWERIATGGYAAGNVNAQN